MSTASISRIRLAVVDGHALFAESLAAALEGEGFLVRRMELDDERVTSAVVLAMVLRSRPDVVLLDIDLGRLGDGARLIAPLTAAGVVVVVVTGSVDRARHGDCLGRGAEVVLLKTCPLGELLAILRRASAGLPLMRAEDRHALVELATKDGRETRTMRIRLERLTRREAEVLGALMRGDHVREIARTCVVSEATVRTQVKSVLSKLDVRSQLAAVGMAHQVGWRPPWSGNRGV